MNSIQFTLNQWEFRSHTVHELSAPGATGTAVGQRRDGRLGGRSWWWGSGRWQARASRSRLLTWMDVLSCVRVRLRVFSQGFGVAASLDTTLVLSSICVEDEAPLTTAQLAPFWEVSCID